MSVMRIDDAADRIRAEYAEMPGLDVTFWQAQRLWNLPDDLCEGALRLLMRSGFLVRTPDGRYRRPHPEDGTLTPAFRPFTHAGRQR
jgi:hypothetical protein